MLAGLPVAILLIALNSIACSATSGQSLAVPCYFNADSLWTRMGNAYPTAQIAVLNPSDGPGDAAELVYAEQVKKSQAAGLSVLGYVPTGYGARDIALVKADIDRYYSWYSVDGIFLDEASTDCQFARPYYSDLYRYGKRNCDKGEVVLNPGMATQECYMEVSDIIVTFEGPYEKYVEDYSAPSWVGEYDSKRFWHLVHSAPKIGDVETAVRLSKERRAGWIYVTPDALPNPWDTLPPDTYWSRELSAIGSSE
jgi:hypothetical protein